MKSRPQQRSYWQLAATVGVGVSFLQGCVSRKPIHALVHVSVPTKMLAIHRWTQWTSRKHEVKMKNVGEIGEKWDAMGTGYTHLRETHCMRAWNSQAIWKKKKYRKGSMLIKSFLSDHGNCAATRIRLYHLKHASLEFFMAEKGKNGNIVFSSITDQ